MTCMRSETRVCVSGETHIQRFEQCSVNSVAGKLNWLRHVKVAAQADLCWRERSWKKHTHHMSIFIINDWCEKTNRGYKINANPIMSWSFSFRKESPCWFCVEKPWLDHHWDLSMGWFVLKKPAGKISKWDQTDISHSTDSQNSQLQPSEG